MTNIPNLPVDKNKTTIISEDKIRHQVEIKKINLYIVCAIILDILCALGFMASFSPTNSILQIITSCTSGIMMISISVLFFFIKKNSIYIYKKKYVLILMAITTVCVMLLFILSVIFATHFSQRNQLDRWEWLSLIPGFVNLGVFCLSISITNSIMLNKPKINNKSHN